MRKTKSRTLEGTELGDLAVEVYEVRPIDLLEIHQDIQGKKLPLGEYERLLPLCTNLTRAQLVKLFPSEFELVLEDFKEVNKSFLAPWPTIKKVAEKVGLVEWGLDVLEKSGFLETMKTMFYMDLQKLSVSLPKEVIEIQNSTDGGILSSPSDLEKEC